MSYSNGGTLTLPSPTHVRSADVSSGLRSIRQTLSRSPSTFRFLTRSPSKSPRKATSPCPSSPKRATSQPQLFAAGQPPYTPSPLVPSLKLALRSSARSNKSAIARPTLSRRTSPKSPMKRVLSQASDSGNATPVSSQSSSSGQENSTSTSPVERKSFERLTRIPFSLDGSAPVNPALSRLGGDASSDSHMTTSTSSPLKRSDAIMNLDQASLGSPAAKRRSLHGSASFGHDFNVFDHGPTSSPQFEIHDDSNQGYELSTGPFSSDSAVSSFTSTPRRSSSLRKSTLQQRHGEKTSWGRRHAAQIALQLANQNSGSTEMSTPNPTKSRPRLSMDQFVAPMPRDSPFSSQGALPNPSLHTMAQPVHQPHPLSRTMTTSSSNSSIGDEAPTHIPVNFGSNPRRPKIDFAKSLPPGATRPFPFDGGSDESGSFATPHNFRNAKPLPSAFASTGGLISKTNRNPEEPIVPRGQGNVNMPDTPCKKHGGVFATYPSPGSAIPGSALVKARHVRHSFGSPSTPHGNQAVPGSFGHGVSVFGSAFGQRGPNRRGSFLSIDGDESGGSPDAKDESQSLADFDLPPTPTKQAFPMSGFPHQLYTSNNSNNRRSLQLQLPTSTGGFGLLKQPHRTSSKLNLSESFAEENEEDSDDASMDLSESPTTSNSRIHVRPSTSDPSFGRSRATKDPHSTLSSPLANSLTTPFLSPSSKPGFTKPSHVAPASPLERIGFFESFAPHTPQDSVTPPDPSGLSISNPKETQATRSGVNNAFMLPPATPTAGRDQFSKKRQSTTPVGSTVTSEIDLSLISRFEKVELFGTGQFSSVYKVTKPAPNFYQFGGTPSQSRTPPTLIPEQVFAVKKSRQPFQGTKDRLRKLQEVNVLKALGGCRHVVHYLDSWEEKNHLYIQTEYCEEGSLEMFLGENGRKGRLDDFRIWKIMLEIGLVREKQFLFEYRTNKS